MKNLIFFSGIRLTFKGLPNDTDAAKAFYPFDDHEIDIFSNSWGPPDNGLFVAGPGPLTQLALQKGTSKVRTTAVWSYTYVTLTLIDPFQFKQDAYSGVYSACKQRNMVPVRDNSSTNKGPKNGYR